MGSLTAVPINFDPETEMLRCKKLTADAAKEFARACAARIEPLPDHRGSEWYKKQIAEVYIEGR